MDSSAANTTNLQSTNYIPNQNVGEATQPVTQPVAPKTVDVTGGEQPAATTVETKETTEAKKDFNIEANQMAANYAKKFIAPWYNKTTNYTFNQNGDGYFLTNSINDADALRHGFKIQFEKDMKYQKLFNEARELFAELDTQNYRYMQHPTLGNMRVAIDAEGKDIGLPEPIDKTGNPFVFDDPKNIHTMLV